MFNAKYSAQVSLRRHLHNENIMVVPCLFTMLSERSMTEISNLYKHILGTVSREIFAKMQEDEIKNFFTDEGIAVGVWHDNKLISIRTVKTGKCWVDKSISELGYFPTREKNMAFTGFCIVDPEFRGNNLQFLTQYYAESILTKTHDTIVTTVSPHNMYSLTNVIASGYNIVGIKDAYGGYLRYVLEKEFSPNYAIRTDKNVSIGYKDLKGQKKAIEAGMIGYKITIHPRSSSVLFAETEECI
mgnify:FL=1